MSMPVRISRNEVKNRTSLSCLKTSVKHRFAYPSA